jgi:FkbH-like protein
MRVVAHAQAPSLDGLKQSILSGAPQFYRLQLRDWLFGKPSVLDFENLYRFLGTNEVSQKLRAELPSEKWALVGGYTTRPVALALKASLLCQGAWADIFESNYGAFDSELLFRHSDIYKFRPDFVLLANGYHNLQTLPTTGADRESVSELVQKTAEYFDRRWEAIKSFSHAKILQHSLCRPPQSSIGRLAEKYEWSEHRFLRRINDYFWQRDGLDISVVDLASLQDRVGTNIFWSPRWYYHGKLPFDPACTGDYATLLNAHLAALKGQSKKCLALDLDGTLWGGVVGDDGVDGVIFGAGNALGEEHLHFCHYLKQLSNAGVILSVVTKNDPIVARSMFNKHEEMPIRLDRFAAFKSGWGTKSESLKALAREINIGLDAIVFIDDNPVECEEVSKAIPELLVLRLVPEAGGILESIDALRLFDRLGLSEEDILRANSYRALQAAQEINNSSVDMTGFLKSLDMKASFRVARERELARVSELFRKTNQFKTSPKIFDQEVLLGMGRDYRCFVSTLEDKFGNHGLVSAALVRIGQEAEIINWVMSCRVFNRELEQFMFHYLCQELAALGTARLVAELTKTEKNSYVHRLFESLGFHEAYAERDVKRFEKALNAGAETYTGPIIRRIESND